LQQELQKLQQENKALLSQRSHLSSKIDSLNELLNVEKQDSQSQTQEIQETSSEEVTRLQEALALAEAEAKKYREQCDSLSAQLMRAQAQARKKAP